MNGPPAEGGVAWRGPLCLCVPSGAGLSRLSKPCVPLALYRSPSMSGPNGEPNLTLGRREEEEEEEEEEEGFGEAEYAAINSMLDQINSCLDHLEEKNDHLHARLKELLESNRQTRLEFQQQLSGGEHGEAANQRPQMDA